jgi:hypothetical protein
MGLLGRLATGEQRFRPIEPPILGQPPSYASIQGRPDHNTSILMNNIGVVVSDIAGSAVAGAAVTSARFFLMNNGIDPLVEANNSITESLDQSARIGALLAEIEDRARYSREGFIEYEHAKLYAILRAKAVELDPSGKGWAGFVFDVSYYCHRMNTDSEQFYGPFNWKESSDQRA